VKNVFYIDFESSRFILMENSNVFIFVKLRDIFLKKWIIFKKFQKLKKFLSGQCSELSVDNRLLDQLILILRDRSN